MTFCIDLIVNLGDGEITDSMDIRNIKNKKVNKDEMASNDEDDNEESNDLSDGMKNLNYFFFQTGFNTLSLCMFVMIVCVLIVYKTTD